MARGAVRMANVDAALLPKKAGLAGGEKAPAEKGAAVVAQKGKLLSDYDRQSTTE